MGMKFTNYPIGEARMKIRILMIGSVMGVVAVTGCSTSGTSSTPAPKGPMTSFGDGTFKVGRDVDDIQAGTYVTKGPPADALADFCFWERSVSGTVEEGSSAKRVTVHAGETFSTTGGCHWKLAK